jgi:hypothetical protein
MAMFVLLVSAAILGRVRAEEIIVNRHFKGDMFSKQGKSVSEQGTLFFKCGLSCFELNSCLQEIHTYVFSAKYHDWMTCEKYNVFNLLS